MFATVEGYQYVKACGEAHPQPGTGDQTVDRFWRHDDDEGSDLMNRAHNSIPIYGLIPSLLSGPASELLPKAVFLRMAAAFAGLYK